MPDRCFKNDLKKYINSITSKTLNSNLPRKKDNYKLLYTQNIASKYVKKKLLQIQWEQINNHSERYWHISHRNEMVTVTWKIGIDMGDLNNIINKLDMWL